MQMEINKNMPLEKINLWDKLSLFNDYFKLHIIAELNGQQVKLVKFKGPFVWYRYETQDKLFLVILGKFIMQFRDRNVLLSRGELLVVPMGIEHCPLAEEEAWVMVIEPAGTANTILLEKN
jgi:mannose-6-phosphate isomerase-like protein (cupin superfamily)